MNNVIVSNKLSDHKIRSEQCSKQEEKLLPVYYLLTSH